MLSSTNVKHIAQLILHVPTEERHLLFRELAAAVGAGGSFFTGSCLEAAAHHYERSGQPSIPEIEVMASRLYSASMEGIILGATFHGEIRVTMPDGTVHRRDVQVTGKVGSPELPGGYLIRAKG